MRFLSILMLILCFAGCKTSEQAPEEEAMAQMEDGITATVKYIELEGGFYGIETDDGESYLPLNLSEEYEEDGLRIVFKMKSRPDVMTTRMWGKTIEITEIAKL